MLLNICRADSTSINKELSPNISSAEVRKAVLKLFLIMFISTVLYYLHLLATVNYGTFQADKKRHDQAIAEARETRKFWEAVTYLEVHAFFV